MSISQSDQPQPDQRPVVGHAHRPELTPRESEVLELFLVGIGDREVASILSLAVDTVRFHLKNLFRKHGVRNRHELAIVALYQRLEAQR